MVTEGNVIFRDTVSGHQRCTVLYIECAVTYRNVADQMQCNRERGCREIDTGQLGVGIITEA